jgi:hypothetical protein
VDRASLLAKQRSPMYTLSRKVDYAPKSAVIVHAPSTAHFKCACGERLRFGSDPGAFPLLIQQRREHGKKIGTCPTCGQAHEIPQGR